MKRTKPHILKTRIISAVFLSFALCISCGLTAFAAEEGSPDLQQTTLPTVIDVPIQPIQEDVTDTVEIELYPADVQCVTTSTGRQIIKTYVLTAQQNPADISRDSFTRDGWRYTLTDITEMRTSRTETRSHTEIVEIETETNDLNEIIQLLAPALDYQSEDGYSGMLSLDISTVNCEVAGYRNNSYTVSATREYPHLSSADTSLIPKTITDNGRTLELDSVSWEVQHYINVDYEDIPDSYRAVASYSARVSRSVATGYITIAEYSGEIAKTISGDTVYTAYFEGVDISPPPEPTPLPEPIATPEPEETPTEAQTSSVPEKTASLIYPILIVLAVLAAIAGTGAYFFLLRHNVKVYKVIDESRVLAAKDKISEKHLTIDLTPLEGRRFVLEIDKPTAKTLNGKTIEVVYGPTNLKHRISFEGNTYNIDVDFGSGTIQAIY